MPKVKNELSKAINLRVSKELLLEIADVKKDFKEQGIELEESGVIRYLIKKGAEEHRKKYEYEMKKVKEKER